MNGKWQKVHTHRQSEREKEQTWHFELTNQTCVLEYAIKLLKLIER